MNDPNGMVYYDGEYHLFYQYYPDSTVWGPMHWGHAVSPDMVRWEDLPIALYPDSLGYIFSGSAVIDRDNTAGFGVDAMVAIFTHHNMAGERAKRLDFQTQSIAYSTDRGRSWTKYADNPVIPNPGIKDFRDPKVTWDADRNQWVMVLAAYDIVKFYTSPNLKDWTFASDFGKELGSHGGVWECPDLFPMTDQNGDRHWVLIVSVQQGSPNGGTGAQYFVGDWNGGEFIVEPGLLDYLESEKDRALWLDYGRDNYAGVTWSNAPDDRTLFMGWMSNWQYAQVVPTERWRSAMTLPRELNLQAFGNGNFTLRTRPVQELQSLRKKSFQLEEAIRIGEETYSPDLDWDLGQEAVQVATSEIQFKTTTNGDTPTEGSFGLRFYNANGDEFLVGYDFAQRRPFTDRRKAGRTDFQEDFATARHDGPTGPFPNQWQLFMDRSSAELFIENGDLVMTDIFFPSDLLNRMEMFNTSGQTIELTELTIWELNEME